MVDVVKPKVRLRGVVMSDSTILKFGDDDALIVVGPNNSGKSQFLHDIDVMLSAQYGQPLLRGKVVTDLDVEAPPRDEIIDSLADLCHEPYDFYNAYGTKVHRNHIVSGFMEIKGRTWFGPAARLFLKRISSDDRLSIVAPSSPLAEGGPETPAQVLYDNEDLLSEVSRIFRRAFGKDLFLDYRSGGSIPIYVGDRPEVPPGNDRVSNEYVRLVRACDKLHEQGDGMKSFGGILLSTLVVNFNITLVDEPEAFLHPPQERIIGKIIAEKTKGQVICSTHSKDVLQGFLESSRRVRVVRIVRQGEINIANEISSDEIETLWRDPVFRYSTALDSLFHDRTILCEADPDCRFFEAIETNISSGDPVDSHYVACGGKAAYPKFIRALRQLAIPVLAILDFDVLNDENTLRAIYEAQGGEWTEIQPLWIRLDKAIREGVETADINATKSKISDILTGWVDGPPPSSDLIEALKQTRAWGRAKTLGLAAVPASDAQGVAEQLLERLANARIYPIPVGTLENFVRSVGNQGLKWLNQVFASHDLNSEKLRDAREFMHRVLS